jgi:hypothetical protein
MTALHPLDLPSQDRGIGMPLHGAGATLQLYTNPGAIVDIPTRPGDLLRKLQSSPYVRTCRPGRVRTRSARDMTGVLHYA